VKLGGCMMKIVTLDSLRKPLILAMLAGLVLDVDRYGNAGVLTYWA